MSTMSSFAVHELALINEHTVVAKTPSFIYAVDLIKWTTSSSVYLEIKLT